MMTLRSVCTLFCFGLSFGAQAQKQLKGIVVDAEKNVPVPKASVFLNNTSIGTSADEEGRFELRVPAGKFELIVTSIGYATHNQTIAAGNADEALTIKLKIKAPELETVVIEPFEKNGWEKWGRWFTDNFIGTSEYASDCRLKNPEVLRFRNSKSRGELMVIGTAPLVIENKGLGYRISYQLENFRYDSKNHYLLYAGYPFFEELPGSDRNQREWEKNREEAYYGSMLQFMRAVYRNRLAQEGFEVRRLKKIPNSEKERVRRIYKTVVRTTDRGISISSANSDSAAYYEDILRQDDYKRILGATPLTGDSIAYAADSVTAGLAFDDYLLVICKNKKPPGAFKQLYPRSGNQLMSEITLINSRPLEVLANGSYFNPEDLLSNGFWGWWEKMGTMLPFNYQPPKNQSAP